MTDEVNGSNDDILDIYKQESSQSKKGKLKIFFGFAPGVGKTYSMLQEARKKLDDGEDVVIGWIEDHDRIDTKNLTIGFEFIAPLNVIYHGTEIKEFDLDRALLRKPKLILVDELAHSNAQGSRHKKRWQDIEELLSFGIDVYTTVNVQHIESLNDAVERITGIRVSETVPDSVIESANQIELVDIPPEDLIERLRAGKVYPGESARRVEENFFKKVNLSGLRELSLRTTARHVDESWQGYLKTEGNEKSVTTDRILVCIDVNSSPTKLIRSGKRIADTLKAPWMVAHVESELRKNKTEQQQRSLHRVMHLAENLGATSISVSGISVAEELLFLIESQKVTHVVIGNTRRNWFKRLFRPNLLEYLLKNAKNCNFTVVDAPLGKPEDLEPDVKDSLVSDNSLRLGKSFEGYVQALSLLATFTLFSLLVIFDTHPVNILLMFILCQLLVSYGIGGGPAILTSVLSPLLFEYLFLEPYLSFASLTKSNGFTLFSMFFVGWIISYQSSNLKKQTLVARENERQALLLFHFTKFLAISKGVTRIAEIAERHLRHDLGLLSAIYIISDSGTLSLLKKSQNYKINEKDINVLEWVRFNNKPAGFGTDTLPSTEATFWPLKSSDKMVGVIGVKPVNKKTTMDSELNNLIETYTSLLGLALERTSNKKQITLGNLTDSYESDIRS